MDYHKMTIINIEKGGQVLKKGQQILKKGHQV